MSMNPVYDQMKTYYAKDIRLLLECCERGQHLSTLALDRLLAAVNIEHLPPALQQHLIHCLHNHMQAANRNRQTQTVSPPPQFVPGAQYHAWKAQQSEPVRQFLHKIEQNIAATVEEIDSFIAGVDWHKLDDAVMADIIDLLSFLPDAEQFIDCLFLTAHAVQAKQKIADVTERVTAGMRLTREDIAALLCDVDWQHAPEDIFAQLKQLLRPG